MESVNVTGTGAVTPAFTTESYSPVRANPEVQQVETEKTERMLEETKGNNIDIIA